MQNRQRVDQKIQIWSKRPSANAIKQTEEQYWEHDTYERGEKRLADDSCLRQKPLRR